MASIKARKNKSGTVISYEISVFKCRDENGKQIFYRTTWRPQPGWCKRTINSKLADFARDFERDCKEGRVLTKAEQALKKQQEAEAEQRKITLRRYATETFMPRKSATFSETTKDTYTRCFERIFHYLGNLRMEDIRPVDITNFLLALQTKETAKQNVGKEIKDTGKPLSYGTIIKHYTVLHSMFRSAFMDDVIPANPMDKVQRPKPRKDDAAPEVQALDTAEARRLLQCLSKEPLQWQAIIRLMLDSGCRRGEICGLRWRSVDFINNTITIENNLQYTPEKGIFNTTPKGKKSRTIDIDPEIMSLLRELRSQQKVTTLEGYCFTQHNGEPLHPQTPTRHLHKFGEKYDFPGLHPHQLRHTAATIAITNGADIASVSAKLGHAETATTLNLYTHANRESIKQANEIYRKALYRKEA